MVKAAPALRHPTRATYRAQVAEGMRALSRADPLMRRLIRKHGDCALSPRWTHTPYEALVRAIIYQQLAGAAAKAIHDRFVASFPGHRFPPADHVAQAPDMLLRAAGLSRQKLSYIRDIAARAAQGSLPASRRAIAHLSDDAIIEQMTQARGVGRWTAEMLLMFTLGRLDVFPAGDYGVRSGFLRASGLDAIGPEALREHALRWGPYRSVAAWYLWRAADA